TSGRRDRRYEFVFNNCLSAEVQLRKSMSPCGPTSGGATSRPRSEGPRSPVIFAPFSRRLTMSELLEAGIPGDALKELMDSLHSLACVARMGYEKTGFALGYELALMFERGEGGWTQRLRQLASHFGSGIHKR